MIKPGLFYKNQRKTAEEKIKAGSITKPTQTDKTNKNIGIIKHPYVKTAG